MNIIAHATALRKVSHFLFHFPFNNGRNQIGKILGMEMELIFEQKQGLHTFLLPHLEAWHRTPCSVGIWANLMDHKEEALL